MTLLFIGTTEIIIIALVILLLFGGAKIPQLMRGLGKGMKEFKDASQGIPSEDEKKEEAAKAEQKAEDTADSKAE